MASTYSDLLSKSQGSYADALDKYQVRITGLKDQADVLGKNQLQQASNYWTQQAANTNQGVFGRGLSNSTISSSLLGGVSQQRAQDIGQINNSVNAQKLALDQESTQAYLSAYERSLAQSQQGGQFSQNLQLQRDQLGQNRYQFDQNLQLQREQLARQGMYGGGGSAFGLGGDGGDGGNGLVNSANSFSAANQAWSMGGGYGGGVGGYPQGYGGYQFFPSNQSGYGGGFTAGGDGGGGYSFFE